MRGRGRGTRSRGANPYMPPTYYHQSGSGAPPPPLISPQMYAVPPGTPMYYGYYGAPQAAAHPPTPAPVAAISPHPHFFPQQAAAAAMYAPAYATPHAHMHAHPHAHAQAITQGLANPSYDTRMGRDAHRGRRYVPRGRGRGRGRPRGEHQSVPCRFYARGRCINGRGCHFDHEHRALCPGFLSGECDEEGTDCIPGSHEPTEFNTPECERYMDNVCPLSADVCPLRHSGGLEFCRQFSSSGVCSRGDECPDFHTEYCRNVSSEHGCSVSSCRMKHVSMVTRFRSQKGLYKSRGSSLTLTGALRFGVGKISDLNLTRFLTTVFDKSALDNNEPEPDAVFKTEDQIEDEGEIAFIDRRGDHGYLSPNIAQEEENENDGDDDANQVRIATPASELAEGELVEGELVDEEGGVIEEEGVIDENKEEVVEEEDDELEELGSDGVELNENEKEKDNDVGNSSTVAMAGATPAPTSIVSNVNDVVDLTKSDTDGWSDGEIGSSSKQRC